MLLNWFKKCRKAIASDANHVEVPKTKVDRQWIIRYDDTGEVVKESTDRNTFFRLKNCGRPFTIMGFAN